MHSNLPTSTHHSTHGFDMLCHFLSIRNHLNGQKLIQQQISRSSKALIIYRLTGNTLLHIILFICISYQFRFDPNFSSSYYSKMIEPCVRNFCAEIKIHIIQTLTTKLISFMLLYLQFASTSSLCIQFSISFVAVFLSSNTKQRCE